MADRRRWAGGRSWNAPLLPAGWLPSDYSGAGAVVMPPGSKTRWRACAAHGAAPVGFCPSSGGDHRSGLSLCRGMPVSFSIDKTNSAGTPRLESLSQYQICDWVVPSRRASLDWPPTASHARCSASFDMTRDHINISVEINLKVHQTKLCTNISVDFYRIIDMGLIHAGYQGLPTLRKCLPSQFVGAAAMQSVSGRVDQDDPAGWRNAPAGTQARHHPSIAM